MSIRHLLRPSCLLLLLIPGFAHAERFTRIRALPAAVPAQQFPMRYLSLGDSLAAGFKAQPATKGYAYRLYLHEAFGTIPNTSFANIALQGSTSKEVLDYQVPQARLLQPKAVTLSVGGNDLIKILESSNPVTTAQTVFADYATNLTTILTTLCDKPTMGEGGDIYINNLYTIPQYDLIFPGANDLTRKLNSIIEIIATSAQQICTDKLGSEVKIHVADVNSEFEGATDALWIDIYERNGIDFPDIHPTNKGYRLMEKAYLKAIGKQVINRHGDRH